MDILVSANVGFYNSAFVASLSDGRCMAAVSLPILARALYGSGVLGRDLRFEWRAGERMLTAGQKAALVAELRSLERNRAGLPVGPDEDPEAENCQPYRVGVGRSRIGECRRNPRNSLMVVQGGLAKK